MKIPDLQVTEVHSVIFPFIGESDGKPDRWIHPSAEKIICQRFFTPNQKGRNMDFAGRLSMPGASTSTWWSVSWCRGVAPSPHEKSANGPART